MRLERCMARCMARFAWQWLVRRGWIVQLNTPDRCHNLREADDGTVYDHGWTPYFSVRYGKQPVFRGPGEVRWRG